MAEKKSHWIKGAINPAHKGMEKRAAERAGMSTRAYMEKHKDDAGSAGKRARLGLTLMGMGHADGGPVQSTAPAGWLAALYSHPRSKPSG